MKCPICGSDERCQAAFCRFPPPKHDPVDFWLGVIAYVFLGFAAVSLALGLWLSKTCAMFYCGGSVF